MKRYQSPLLLGRLFHTRYLHLHISHSNVVTPCRGRHRADVGLMPTCGDAGYLFGSRHYSSGFLGAARISESYDLNHSNGGIEMSETVHDFPRVGNSSHGSGADYGQNVGHYQRWSSSENHDALKDGANARDIGHNDVKKAVQPIPSYSGTRNATASQQFHGRWSTISDPSQGHPSEASVAHHPSQENTVQPSLNSSHPTYEVEAPSGHCNTPIQHRQSLNVPYKANILPQRQLSAAGGNSHQNDEIVGNDDDGATLEEFDALCNDWDLERAVICMTNLGRRGVGVDLPRYLALINACGEAKALEEGKAVHEHLLNFFSPVSTNIFNRMLEMYGKCGSMNDAYDLFKKMPERNLTSWDNMIGWYAKNGLGEEAIDMFTKFKEAGLKPDGEIFFGLFDACGVVGDVTEGMLHFASMSSIYGIIPTMAHYASVVRMFGSAGDLDGALEFIEKMPVEPSVDVWENLMNISRIQGNVELGDRCAQIVDQLDPSRLTKESKVGLLPLKDSDTLKKKVRKASVLNQTQHEYRAGDRSHPEHEKIYALLRGLKQSMKEAGYVPETRLVLHDIDQEEKEEAIMAHSERLACAYSLLTSNPRAQMRIIKNLRICGDCHNVFKIISTLVGRVIVNRDAKRFHHFKDGKCSCNDYW